MAGRVNKVQKLEREAAASAQQAQLMPCGRGGCKNPARTKFNGRWLCFDCRNDLKSEESRKFCEAKGLRTVDEMRAYCRDTARKIGQGVSFETWAKNITQKTVDIIARGGARSDEACLERLRAAGAIDGRSRVIPQDARAVAKAAYLAERARLIVQTEEELRARAAQREPGSDDETTA